MWSAKLVTFDNAACVVVTPAGHDLLATVPHLPAPEPVSPPPACSRCGGSGEVPLFMGPMMMDCPTCAPKAADVASDRSLSDALVMGNKATVWTIRYDPLLSPRGTERTADEYTRVMQTMKVRWAGTLDPDPPEYEPVSFRCHPRDLPPATSGRDALERMADFNARPIGEGWVHITSEGKATAFAGKRVEIRAPASAASGGWSASPYLRGGATISWKPRGNVYLRLVTE